MQRREQYLLAVLLSFFVLYMGSTTLYSAIFGPFETRIAELNNLKKSISDKNDTMLQYARASKQLNEWRSMSLPPDEPGKSKLPTGFDAGRMYLPWLTDLAQLCGFEDIKATPGTAPRRGKNYVPIVVKIEAQARHEQLVRFLDLFYRTRLLHRITAINVQTKVYEGDPLLSIRLDAEGLVVLDAPRRRSLFPQTKIEEFLSETDTSLQVEDGKDFPKQPGFRIQIKNEFLRVTAIDDTTWTVERGLEQTTPAAYSDGTNVELLQLDPRQPDRSLEDLRAFVAANIFVKPPPPQQFKLGPLSERLIVRGRSNPFTIPASGFDSMRGRPVFSIVGDPPPGLKLDRSGRVEWRPEDSVPAGLYTLKFDVRHPSIEGGSVTESLAIRLRDPKSPPKLKSASSPKVYLNREWSYKPELSGSEMDAAGYTWKLGDRSPAGMTIDSKTGELKWTPGDSAAIGDTNVSIVVTDGDSPPQSTALSLKLDVQDDAAQFTLLTGCVTVGKNKQLFMFDQSRDKNTILHEGDSFTVADIVGTIKQIGLRHAIVKLGQQEKRWEVGQSLRDIQTQ